MKDFTELTEEEMLALTESEIETYIDLAAAEAGVQLLPPAPIAPKSIDVSFDVPTWSVGSFIFTTKSEALDVRDAVNKTKSRVDAVYAAGPYAYSGPRKVVAHDEPAEVLEARYLSEDNAAQRAGMLADAEAEKESYAKARTNYEKILLWRNQTRTPIVTAIRDARRKAMRRLELFGDYNRYLALADNNRRVAARFLRHAHADAEELLPECFTFKEADAPLPRKYFDDPEPKASTLPEEETVF